MEKNFIEKNINENVKNIYPISEIYFYTENVCVTNKISIFLKYIFIPQKKNFDHKKYSCQNFVVNSVTWSVKFRKQPICGIP